MGPSLPSASIKTYPHFANIISFRTSPQPTPLVFLEAFGIKTQMCGFIGQLYSEPLRCFEGLYKQVGIRSQAWGGVRCLSTDLLGNLEQVVSPLLVCLFIGKRRVLAQVGAEVPRKGQALWVGTRPRAPTPILAGHPPTPP